MSDEYDPVEQLRGSILTRCYIMPIKHQQDLLNVIERLNDQVRDLSASLAYAHHFGA